MFVCGVTHTDFSVGEFGSLCALEIVLVWDFVEGNRGSLCAQLEL